MTAVIDMPRSRPLTVADLADRPDDGHRYELLDGVLIVTPAPSMRHQDAALSLAVLLRAACPPALKVLTAPFDVTLADDTVLQPDVLVFDRKQVTARDLPGAPLLAVEVLSPSTRRFDLHLKRSRYEAAGTAATRRGHPLERIFRDARCGSLQPATSDVCADWLGAAALDLEPETAGEVPRW